MKIQAILPAAGAGERMKSQIPKPLLLLHGKPVIVRTIEVFEACEAVDSIILVVHPDYRKDYEDVVKKTDFKKTVLIVEGGETRTQSVRNGLGALDKDTTCVMIHDGVRPCITRDVIERGLKEIKDEKALVAAVGVKPTLKVVDPQTRLVTETLDRSLVWEIQTPQIFERGLLERAYRKDTEGATDDAALVERLGVKVKVFLGDYQNIKITTPEDMLIAEAFLERK
ncbi:MAG: 2-C-methyl-D-erythritol 4-phosphate cytidylyltransferase [Candidatus Omnitrophica bacterium]|nr:2-C-methyl-D-erythritol 4-phosphate cytidylyltransferase [Candidatus Omnitrophota bacterium]